MKVIATSFVVIVAVAALVAPGCGSGGQPPAPPVTEEPATNVRVDGTQARALVAQGATLLDVRTEGEWGARHLDGAVLIPVQELGGRLAEVPRDKPVVVYCASGARSSQAVAMLREAGYDARDLGGMSRWGG